MTERINIHEPVTAICNAIGIEPTLVKKLTTSVHRFRVVT